MFSSKILQFYWMWCIMNLVLKQKHKLNDVNGTDKSIKCIMFMAYSMRY